MIATDPDDLIPVPLACPDDTAEERRPVLLCRAMSGKEWKAYARLLADSAGHFNEPREAELLAQALDMTVRGFRNVTAEDGATALTYGPGVWDEWSPARVRVMAALLPDALALQEQDHFLSRYSPAFGRAKPGAGAAGQNAKAPAPTAPAQATPS